MAYTVLALAAAVVVVVAELAWFRTGLLRQRAYWMSMGIVFFFQVLVDGWLTKLSAPIVRYSSAHFSDLRFPLDIPIEDFLYGFALVTATMVLWDWLGRRRSMGS